MVWRLRASAGAGLPQTLQKRGLAWLGWASWLPKLGPRLLHEHSFMLSQHPRFTGILKSD